MPQKAPKMPQDDPNRAQDDPKRGPCGSKRKAKRVQNKIFRFFKKYSFSFVFSIKIASWEVRESYFGTSIVMMYGAWCQLWLHVCQSWSHEPQIGNMRCNKSSLGASKEAHEAPKVPKYPMSFLTHSRKSSFTPPPQAGNYITRYKK